MPELLRCIECGTPITSHDHECPHCHTEYPLGVVCLGCFESLKQSTAVQHETHSTHSVKYFHASCYQKIMQPLSANARSVDESFNSGTRGNSDHRGNSYNQKTLDKLIREEAKIANLQYSKNRLERLIRKIRKTLKFIIVGVFGFIFWGAILSYIFGFGEIGLFMAFIVTLIVTVQFMKEV
jgi:hypothetical protein